MRMWQGFTTDVLLLPFKYWVWSLLLWQHTMPGAGLASISLTAVLINRPEQESRLTAELTLAAVEMWGENLLQVHQIPLTKNQKNYLTEAVTLTYSRLFLKSLLIYDISLKVYNLPSLSPTQVFTFHRHRRVRWSYAQTVAIFFVDSPLHKRLRWETNVHLRSFYENVISADL